MNVRPNPGPNFAPVKAAQPGRPIFFYTSKPHIFILLFAVIVSAAAGLLQPAMAIIFGRYFQVFSDYASGKIDGPALMERSLSSIYALLGIGLCTFFLKGGLLASWLVFGEMQAKGVREQLFQALLDREIEWYDERTIGVGTLLARMQTYDTSCWRPSTTDQSRQIREFQLGASQPLGLSILALVQALCSLGLAFHTNWKLTLVVLSVVPVIALGVALLSRQTQIYVEMHSRRLTQATKVANNIITNITMVKCFNTQEQEGQQYHSAVKDATVSSWKQAVFSAAQTGFVRFAGTTMFVQGIQTTFIIGRSGSGKSTVGQLLLRFYEAQNGTISIDGHDLQDIETTWIRNNITLVQQQTILFTETVFKNIALGHHNYSRVTASRVGSCLKMADLQSTIEALPQGVDTKVGRGGSSLSGGQKQRIAIARARLRDTPVLIMDEATSALDSTSRTSVMQAIRRWRQNKTTIIITHDLTQIHCEDMVYVLDGGRVVLKGRWSDVGDLSKEVSTGSNGPQQGFEAHRNCSSVGMLLDQCPNEDQANEALVSSPDCSVRKASFDAEMEAVAENKPVTSNRPIMSSGPLSRRLKMELSVSAGAVLNHLKRQSLARANAMYVLGHIQPRVGPLRNWPPAVQKGHISMRAATFLSSPRTPEFISKPLPVPPLMLELGDRNEWYPDATSKRRAAVAEEEHKTYSTSAILATVWPALNTSDRIRLICGLIATLCHAGAPATFSYTLVQVFGTYSLSTGYREKALVYSMAVLGIAVVDGVVSFLMQYLLVGASQTWVDDLRMAAMKVILRQPRGWFDEEMNRPAGLVSCLDGSAEEIKDLVGRFAAQLLVVAVMMVVAVVWSFITCWKITLVSLAATPLLYLLTRCFESVSSHWEARTNEACEQIGDIYVETFTDIKTVRSLTLESYFHQKYNRATAEALSIGRRRAIISGLLFGLSDSAIIFFTPLIFWYGARLAKDREWPVSSILEVFSLLLFCTANASAVVAYIPEISTAKNAANRLLRLVRTPVISHEDVGEVQLNEKNPNTLFGPIHFINLTFSYPTRPEVAVLRRLNLTIAPGKCTAIVGASGSGKSTIASLLLGLYPPEADHMALSSPTDPSGGPPSLTLAGRDIRSLDLAGLRSLIAIVPQAPILLPTTVRGNISYGLAPDSPLASAVRIESAAQLAGIHEFIQSLPQGYATIIGDGGLGVSGGQAQRIVIARALVRRPRILILDEATSALDSESAAIIRSSVKKLLHQKEQRLTVVVVTHAKEMMAFADHVVVLGQGIVVEQGSFPELLSRRAALWEMLRLERGCEQGHG
ncbi:hypothetical protein A1O3_07666 [Capronia epimyces CBS 606.96]|uniref:ABC multidrug transporter MDR2 n=1 Tax=Capronia epimyces CBS 606.96 TaxID=1182542 RepID=W9XVM9_9EURO|nr:uncharacterized protein A1O3_07666 [Capronia epimyces CBS 606.96]EXJ81375.1 hypothetical protein A1O3_07666 [Capronia epimyces CBS 606.96]